jgi:lipopolysaccharide/colanic/teichoic acid biosynthesis glycosyltransferase
LEEGLFSDDARPSADLSGPKWRPYGAIKPVIEWIAAFFVFAAALPVFAMLVVLVKATSNGPAFYSQTRLGLAGRSFRIYKLRTMTHNCEQVTGPVWSLADDPRVTRVGRWLRDTHLDELPQLWNVLCGDMSLVGPRPERPELAEKIVRSLPQFRLRLAVRPGITGLAQVRLPPDSDINTVQRKLTCDLHYIRNCSLVLDARIAVSTALQLAGSATTSGLHWLADRCIPDVEMEPALAPIHADAHHFRVSGVAVDTQREPSSELHIAA